MKRILKISIICFGILGVLIICFYIFNYMLFSGVFDKKYSREELENNFVKYESDFQELVVYFQSVIPSSYLENYQISFGLGKNDKYISIMLYPLIVNSSTNSIGGTDLQKDSLEFNNILKTLRWNKETVNTLEKKLSVVNCDIIRTVDYYGGCKFEIYPKQS
ncbi:MAG: hypothetical protein LBG92_12845, partial [Prevotellaceae bacterium]|nr:hypothetical protein [Prevotellaceae bacterium]